MPVVVLAPPLSDHMVLFSVVKCFYFQQDIVNVYVTVTVYIVIFYTTFSHHLFFCLQMCKFSAEKTLYILQQNVCD